MGRLAEIVRPTVGLVTNIHPAHLEGLGSLDEVLAEKGKLFASLGSDDLAVINDDDEKLRVLAGRLQCRMIRFGAGSPSVEVGLRSRVVVEDGQSSFDLGLGSDTVRICLPVLGMHQVQNALAAAAVAWGLGETAETISRGLGGHQPVRQRMEVRRLPRGMVLIDDTYNANPRSMIAAVRSAREAAPNAPLIVILGDMRELGPESSAMHHDVGVQIGGLGMSRLITLGELSRAIGVGARRAGMAESACFHVSTHAEAVGKACESLVRDAWIVVKGSRGMTMEKVVAGILDCVMPASRNG
jgi:UDP-N-acetylmuramoyl-tripeptide--D-alanyl-D-alanine ligase